MIFPIFYALLVALVVDGFKLLIESYAKFKEQKYTFSKNRITAIIAAHNEADVILETVKSVGEVIGEKNIIVVDDASTDNTTEILVASRFKGKIICIHHSGKVGAITQALKSVKTKYILLLDADVRLNPYFVLPTSSLDSGEATAITFNIVPEKNWKNAWQRFWITLQTHEYAKSMQIGKRYQDFTKSVHCISGAAGLFRTDRLRVLSKEHSGIFPGEDLERTLLELDADGKVAFSHQEIVTDVPNNFRKLSRQRIIGWWPGLWRNMWKFFRLTVKRNVPFRLRWELTYELFSLFTDPFKVVSLSYLIWYGQWGLLTTVYIVYLLFELIVYWRIRIIEGSYLQPYATAIVLFYPFYSMLNMFYRVMALGVFIYKILFTEWRKAIFMLMFLPALSMAEDWSLNASYNRVTDISKERNWNHYTVDFGYQNYYIGGTYGAWKQANVGFYHQYGFCDVRLRNNDVALKAQGEYWFGNWVPRASVSYIRLFQAGEYPEQNYPIGGVGLAYYTDDGYISIDAIKEWGRAYGITYIGKYNQHFNPWWFTIGSSITNFGDPGFFTQVGYDFIYLDYGFYKRYDFESFNRTFIGIGTLIKW